MSSFSFYRPSSFSRRFRARHPTGSPPLACCVCIRAYAIAFVISSCPDSPLLHRNTGLTGLRPFLCLPYANVMHISKAHERAAALSGTTCNRALSLPLGRFRRELPFKTWPHHSFSSLFARVRRNKCVSPPR